MPPRKSNVSVTTNGEGDASIASVKAKDAIGVEDLNLPRTMIQRLAKGVLPSNTQIQKDALLAMSKSATVFVNFLASIAAEHAEANNKKTIMPHDVFAALKDQEFEAFLPRVQAECQRYNDIQCDKRNTYRRSKKAEQSATGEIDVLGKDLDGLDEEPATAADDPDRPTKRTRIDGENDLGDDGDAEDGQPGSDVDDDVDEDSADDVADDVDEEVDEAENDAEDTTDGHDIALHGVRDEALDEPDSD